MEHVHNCECIDMHCPACREALGLLPTPDAVVLYPESVFA